jgi:hypothetical protein
MYWLSPYLCPTESWDFQSQHPPLPSPKSCVLCHQAVQVCQGSRLSNVLLKVSRSFPTTVMLLVVLQFTVQIPCADAVDLTGAVLEYRSNRTQRRTQRIPQNPLLCLVSHSQCFMECGSGMGNVNWQGLSQNFGAWLSPWIASMFQIPFRVERKH